MINAPPWRDENEAPPNHPWYQEFDAGREQDNAEAASKALANVATGPVLVFGAIDYKSFPESFFTSKEIKRIRKGIRAGRITAIHHMAKGARSPDDVMAIEDENGNVVWQPGYSEGTENASIDCNGGNTDSLNPSSEEDNENDNVTKRSLQYGRCGPPKINRKRKPQRCSATHINGKRAVDSKQHSAACPLKRPTCGPARRKAGKCTPQRCTVAMKNAGKCDTNQKCTAAMKTAGACNIQKCIMAMKKASKCGIKKGNKTGKLTAKKTPKHGKKATRKHPKRPSKAGGKVPKKGRGRASH